jgi:cyclic pyranopterin phosphate synthase
MVDVTSKLPTHRRAVARSVVKLGRASQALFSEQSELLCAARVAGIQAAKQTAELIPLCHPLGSPITEITLSVGDGCIEIESRSEVFGPTGIEMEALTACTVAGLTVLAAVLPSDPDAYVEGLGLWEKSGGRSGTWVRG